jgi:protein-tyrosine phosphatase
MHRHLDAVALPDGTTVWAATWVGEYVRDRRPDFGYYLDAKWQPSWPHVHLDWPDFGVPGDPAVVVDAFTDVLARARRDEVVEIGCWGGHGRTGTALACLAVMTGVDGDPVEWVRANYCAKAVETDEQAAFARTFGDYVPPK